MPTTIIKAVNSACNVEWHKILFAQTNSHNCQIVTDNQEVSGLEEIQFTGVEFTPNDHMHNILVITIIYSKNSCH
jgi:hypothetical protein